MALGILCPGQGSQHARMFDQLKDVPEALAVLRTLDAIIGTDPLELLPSEIHVNCIAQPLVCAIQLATWSALRGRLPRPVAFAGYSVGELGAYGCAGSLSTADVLRLARRRAELMDAAGDQPGGLLAVRGLRQNVVETIAGREGCLIAIVNGEDRFVVGGPRASLPRFEAMALEAGAKTTPLNIGIASHTPMMAAAREPFISAMKQCEWRTPTAPVIAGISGVPIRRGTDAITTLGEQVAARIDWATCLDTLVERGCTAFLELGPGEGLARMALDRHPRVVARSCSEFSTLDGVTKWGRNVAND